MIEDKKVLAIIPARGGSKGLPHKNILPVNNKPLIAWTITEAQKSKYIDSLILSSEDAKIINIAQKWGCEVPFVRPEQLATDETTGMAVVLHAIENTSAEYELIVLLQPTSPLREVQDIDACIQACCSQNAPACVTVTETEKPPFWMFYLQNDRTMTPVLPDKECLKRRQDLPATYVLNGAVYVGQRQFILQNKNFIHNDTIAHIMPKERSLDIDTKFDFKLFEAIGLAKK